MPAHERALTERLAFFARDGEVVWLDSQHGRFFGIYQKPRRQPARGALLILPQPAHFAGAPGLLAALRDYPPTAGWATLALQLPLPSDSPAELGDAEPPGATLARVGAAIDQLRTFGFKNIVVVAQGRSIALALQYLADSGEATLRALVGIGKWGGTAEEATVPILDIAGTRDDAAYALAQRRQRWFAGEPERAYELLVIDGADRRFSGYETMVAKRVRGWAERVTEGKQVTR